MLKEKTMCVGDLVNNRDFDVNCNFDVYDCTKPGTDWTDGAKRIFSTIEDGWVEPPDDSVITPRLDAGVVTRLKMNLRSPSLMPHRPCRIRHQIPVRYHVTARTKSELELSVSESGNEELCSELSPVLDERSRCNLRCCVYRVSDSPYTSSNLRTDGQPEVGRGLPSIDDVLKMAIRYVTLDFSRHTIVVEAGRAS